MIYDDVGEKKLVAIAVLILISSIMLLFYSPLLFFLCIAIISPSIEEPLRVLIKPIVLVIAITFFSSLKPFADLAEYLSIYHQLGDGSISVFSYQRFGFGFEFVYLLFMKIISIISNVNDQVLLISTYSLIFILICKISSVAEKRFSILFFGLFFFSLGFVETASYFIRQILSITFFFYGLIYCKSKTARAFLFLLSLFSHLSAIINIAIYIGYSLSKNNRKWMWVFAFSAVGVAAIIGMTPFFDVAIQKMNDTALNSNFSTMPIAYILLTTVNVMFILGVNYGCKIKGGIFSFIFLKEVFLFYLLLPYPALSNRVSMIIFSFYPVFLFPLLSNVNVSVRKKNSILLLMLIINLPPYLYAMKNISSSGNLYTFYQNRPFTESLYGVFSYFDEAITNGVKYINDGNK